MAATATGARQFLVERLSAYGKPHDGSAAPSRLLRHRSALQGRSAEIACTRRNCFQKNKSLALGRLPERLSESQDENGPA